MPPPQQPQSLAEALLDMDRQVEAHRFGMGHAEDDGPGRPAYAITIGLVQAVGHPELIVMGVDAGVGFGLLTELGDRVIGGERLEPWSIVDIEDIPFGVAPVHPHHLIALMEFWRVYWESRGDLSPCRALHVILPVPFDAPDEARIRYRLDVPGDLVPIRLDERNN